MRDERGAGGSGKGAASADEEQDGVDGQDAVRAMEGDGEQAGGTEHLERVADQDDLTAVETIGDVSGREQKEQAGQEEGEAGIAKVEGTMGDGVDLPRDGDRLRFGPEDGHDASELVAAEVAGREGLETAPRDPWDMGRHQPIG